VVDVCYNPNNESITDAIATTANVDNGEKVNGKDGNGINDQRQISMLKMEERLSTTTK
jgi:hypothetical protein